MQINKKKTITAQNTFTAWVNLNGTFNVLISGLVGSIVTFQGSIDGGITPYDIHGVALDQTQNTEECLAIQPTCTE